MKVIQVVALIVCTSALAVAVASKARQDRTYVLPPTNPGAPGSLPEIPGVPNIKQIYEHIYGKLPSPLPAANMEDGAFNFGDIFPIPTDLGNIIFAVQETAIRVVTWIMNTLAEILDNVLNIRKLLENTINPRYKSRDASRGN